MGEKGNYEKEGEMDAGGPERPWDDGRRVGGDLTPPATSPRGGFRGREVEGNGPYKPAPPPKPTPSQQQLQEAAAAEGGGAGGGSGPTPPPYRMPPLPMVPQQFQQQQQQLPGVSSQLSDGHHYQGDAVEGILPGAPEASPPLHTHSSKFPIEREVIVSSAEKASDTFKAKIPLIQDYGKRLVGGVVSGGGVGGGSGVGGVVGRGGAGTSAVAPDAPVKQMAWTEAAGKSPGRKVVPNISQQQHHQHHHQQHKPPPNTHVHGGIYGQHFQSPDGSIHTRQLRDTMSPHQYNGQQMGAIPRREWSNSTMTAGDDGPSHRNPGEYAQSHQQSMRNDSGITWSTPNSQQSGTYGNAQCNLGPPKVDPAQEDAKGESTVVNSGSVRQKVDEMEVEQHLSRTDYDVEAGIMDGEKGAGRLSNQQSSSKPFPSRTYHHIKDMISSRFGGGSKVPRDAMGGGGAGVGDAEGPLDTPAQRGGGKETSRPQQGLNNSGCRSIPNLNEASSSRAMPCIPQQPSNRKSNNLADRDEGHQRPEGHYQQSPAQQFRKTDNSSGGNRADLGQSGNEQCVDQPHGAARRELMHQKGGYQWAGPSAGDDYGHSGVRRNPRREGVEVGGGGRKGGEEESIEEGVGSGSMGGGSSDYEKAARRSGRSTSTDSGRGTAGHGAVGGSRKGTPHEGGEKRDGPDPASRAAHYSQQHPEHDTEWVDVVESELQQILDPKLHSMDGGYGMTISGVANSVVSESMSMTPPLPPLSPGGSPPSSPLCAHKDRGKHYKLSSSMPYINKSSGPVEQKIHGSNSHMLAHGGVPHHMVGGQGKGGGGLGGGSSSRLYQAISHPSGISMSVTKGRQQERGAGPGRGVSSSAEGGGGMAGRGGGAWWPGSGRGSNKGSTPGFTDRGRAATRKDQQYHGGPSSSVKAMLGNAIPLASFGAPPGFDNGDMTSTTTGLDLDSMLDGLTENTSEEDMNATIDTTDAHAIRKQLEGLENMYSEVLKLLGVKKHGSRYQPSDPRINKRRMYGSLSSLPSSASSRPMRDKRRHEDRKKVKDIKGINKRFQRLESHVVTLARSVAHLSSEMRTQHLMMQEIETMRGEIAQLRAQPMRSPSVPWLTAKGPIEKDSFCNNVPALTNPERVKKLTKFFGDEPPLLRIFLKKLGYEKYASAFEHERIGLVELPYLTEERLQKMGIPMGPRLRILQEAQLSFCQENVSVYVV
ncbi:uncharacterized protein [Hetaerina americana]|uniref:uncharacterized protein n=1 Tax=Hetaerina americana TaxID=62018 RepID=UPI003A7F339E